VSKSGENFSQGKNWGGRMKSGRIEARVTPEQEEKVRRASKILDRPMSWVVAWLVDRLDLKKLNKNSGKTDKAI
jgi:hypothetical protein